MTTPIINFSIISISKKNYKINRTQHLAKPLAKFKKKFNEIKQNKNLVVLEQN